MTSYVLTEQIKHDVIDTVYNISLHTTHHRVQAYMHTSTTLICIIHVHIRNIDTPLQLHLGINRLSQFLFLLLKAVVGYRMTVNASPINPKTVAYAIISQQKRPKATFCIILPAIFSLQKMRDQYGVCGEGCGQHTELNTCVSQCLHLVDPRQLFALTVLAG